MVVPPAVGQIDLRRPHAVVFPYRFRLREVERRTRDGEKFAVRNQLVVGRGDIRRVEKQLVIEDRAAVAFAA